MRKQLFSKLYSSSVPLINYSNVRVFTEHPENTPLVRGGMGKCVKVWGSVWGECRKCEKSVREDMGKRVGVWGGGEEKCRKRCVAV